VLIPKVEVAETLLSRTVGLIGRSNLLPDEALWIPRCRAVHTCGMRVPMDAVFMDRRLRVVAVRESVAPFRFPRPCWRAWGVLELRANRAKELAIQVGDTLTLEEG